MLGSLLCPLLVLHESLFGTPSNLNLIASTEHKAVVSCRDTYVLRGSLAMTTMHRMVDELEVLLSKTQVSLELLIVAKKAPCYFLFSNGPCRVVFKNHHATVAMMVPSNGIP